MCIFIVCAILFLLWHDGRFFFTFLCGILFGVVIVFVGIEFREQPADVDFVGEIKAIEVGGKSNMILLMWIRDCVFMMSIFWVM